MLAFLGQKSERLGGCGKGINLPSDVDQDHDLDQQGSQLRKQFQRYRNSRYKTSLNSYIETVLYNVQLEPADFLAGYESSF